jgi:hypothetical protein
MKEDSVNTEAVITGGERDRMKEGNVNTESVVTRGGEGEGRKIL